MSQILEDFQLDTLANYTHFLKPQSEAYPALGHKGYMPPLNMHSMFKPLIKNELMGGRQCRRKN